MEDINIEELLKDRNKFDSFIYTPIEDAVKELRRRWNNPNIPSPNSVPKILEDGFKAILYVAVISPNYQIRRYIHIADALDLTTVVFEQQKDKFTSNNEWKHSLGQLRFFAGKGKKGGTKIERINIIDFNKFNGKPITLIKTQNGKSLIDFHHEWYLNTFPHLNLRQNVFEGSDWFSKQGSNPKEYYIAFLSLLIKHGIQFENFMLNEKELFFTREVFLPAFIHVYKETGLKPLIVALEPIETEGDEFWISYPAEEKTFVLDKLGIKI